jgi:nucleotide-binding universal stress UspA family protein
MERYRKILVAVDGSESGRNAFRQACRIVRHNNSWITAITVIPPYQDQFQTLNVREKVSSALREEGEKILAGIRKIAGEEEIYAKEILAEGSPIDCILNTAEENNFDLIVMGRRGRSRIEKALVGSVAGRVIGMSRHDVLVVPRSTVVAWDTLLVSTDGSKSSRSATEKALMLAETYGSRLKALSVVDVTEEFQAQAPDAVEALVNTARKYVTEITSLAAARGIEAEPFVREGESYAVITNLARDLSISMIIIGSHGRTGMKRLFMGSVAEKVIGYAPCPVLVAKSQELH